MERGFFTGDFRERRDFVFISGCVEEGSGNELLHPWGSRWGTLGEGESVYRELEERVQGGPFTGNPEGYVK
jgi:hypothetical protein